MHQPNTQAVARLRQRYEEQIANYRAMVILASIVIRLDGCFVGQTLVGRKSVYNYKTT